MIDAPDVALLAPTQETLDHITSAAGTALNATAVFASLVDPERKLVTSSYGLPAPIAMLISYAFWKQVAALGRPLVVSDARQNTLLVRIPAVRDGTVRACIAMSLATTDGGSVGTLLAMDRKPRLWTPPQVDLFARLASLIVSEVEPNDHAYRALSGAVRCEGAPAHCER